MAWTLGGGGGGGEGAVRGRCRRRSSSSSPRRREPGWSRGSQSRGNRRRGLQCHPVPLFAGGGCECRGQPVAGRWVAGAMATPEPLRPRLCCLVRGEHGYGFHLHGEKGRRGQFIRRVEPGSPAEAAELRAGDRLVEVNGVNVEGETHHQVGACAQASALCSGPEGGRTRACVPPAPGGGGRSHGGDGRRPPS